MRPLPVSFATSLGMEVAARSRHVCIVLSSACSLARVAGESRQLRQSVWENGQGAPNLDGAFDGAGGVSAPEETGSFGEPEYSTESWVNGTFEKVLAKKGSPDPPDPCCCDFTDCLLDTCAPFNRIGPPDDMRAVGETRGARESERSADLREDIEMVLSKKNFCCCEELMCELGTCAIPIIR